MADGVLSVTYVSADEAWEKLPAKTYFGGSEEAAEGFANDNPLATSDNYEVYLSDVSKQDDVVALAKSLPGVRPDDGENEGVKKSDVVADTLTSVNRLVGYVSAAIILILLVVSVFLISNTVTMGVTVRREEIAIMKYIGAKDGFVRAPFIFEGLSDRSHRRADPAGTSVLYVRTGGGIHHDKVQSSEKYYRLPSGHHSLSDAASYWDRAGSGNRIPGKFHDDFGNI